METKKQTSRSDLQPNGERLVSATTDDLTAPEALERIRSILFGEEIERNAARHTQLNDRLSAGIAALRGDLSTQIRSLEDRLERLANESAENLAKEARERSDMIRQTETLLADVDAKTVSRITAAEARITEVSEIAASNLSDAQKDLHANVDYQIEQLKSFVDEAVTSLAKGKADKQALADWFDELSTRLRK